MPKSKALPESLSHIEQNYLNRVAYVTRALQRVPRRPEKKETKADRYQQMYEKHLAAPLFRADDGQGLRLDPSGAMAKMATNATYTGNYFNINGIIYPEYNLLEAFTIYDTEAYVKQAVTRKLALARKAGWEIVDLQDRNKKDAVYIRNRLATMEYVMGQSTSAFLEDILIILLLCSNCFLHKIRDTKGSGGSKMERNGKKTPVAGYAIIPPHQLLPYLKKGRIAFWRRFYDTGAPWVDIPLEDIVHLKWDVKPGHIFGTPRLVAVREDIFALRRLEENIELLFMNHLFPLFHVAVGDEKERASYGPNGESEVELIKYAIESMPKEGVFVTDERVKVEKVGAEGESLETKNIIQHLKDRIFTGLGVSALDMGEVSANRATADNVSQNLKDLVKADLEVLADLIRFHLFREWFLEAPYNLSVIKSTGAVHLRFHEIDLDNKIKLENHYIQLFLNNAITEDEFRSLLKRDPLTTAQEKKTHYWLHIRDLAIVTAKAKADFAAQASPGAGTSGNKARPANQHGRNPAPTKAKSAKEAFSEIARDKLDGARGLLLSEGQDFLSRTRDGKETVWQKASRNAIRSAFDEFSTLYPEQGDENSYTKQLRQGLADLEALVGSIPDPEMLSILIDSGVGTSSLEELYDDAEMESAVAGETSPE